MTTARPPLKPARWVLACLLLGAAATPAPADDRGLLRTATQTPYVFIILDTSGSMAEMPNGNPAAANADDPSSKLYSAKQAAYNVFSSVANVNFGFASFQQDNLRVIGKHWLYTAAAGTTAATAGFPVPWPQDGEQWVFGQFFPAGTTGPSGIPAITIPGTLGSCAGGVSLSSFKTQLDRFPKLQDVDSGTHLVADADASLPTVMNITSGGKTYIYTVSRDPNKPNLGDATIKVDVKVVPCTGTGSFSATLTFNLGAPANGSVPAIPGPFLMNETAGATSSSGVCSDTQAVCSNVAPCAGKKATCVMTGDDQSGSWNYSDVLQSWAGGGLGNGLSKQASGMGWEGNYDGTYTNPPLPSDPIQGRQADAFNTGYDPYGVNPGCSFSASGAAASGCPQNLKQPTTIAPPLPGLNLSTAALDTGDLLPMNWNNSNQAAFLSRMAPNQAFGTPDFTQADYFADLPDPLTGLLALKDPGQIPLLAAGPTPLGGAIIDFRCWYIGDSKGGSKCSSAGNYSAAPWQPLANTESSTWGCAKPFLILITDGNDSFGSPDPGADVANLKNKTAPSVQTWVIDYGGDCAKAGNPIHSIVQVGKGQCINASDPSSLQAALQQILGLILEQTRAFATAAVPSVQATSADKIYLSDFTPTGGSGLPGTVTGPNSTWEGHLNAFLKPLLSDAASRTCSKLALNDQSDCFLWDGGAQVASQVPAAAPVLGSDAGRRRIFYSMFAAKGTWSGSTCGLSGTGTLPCRRLLVQTSDKDLGPIRYDLWTAFQQAFHTDNPSVDETAQSAVNNVITTTESLKMHSFTVNGVVQPPVSYILGDIFHSNPLIVGTPTNTKYFALNLASNNGTCTDDAATNTDTGYRCFETRHANRRKLLFVGSNDGMLHAFDAGQPHLVQAGTCSDNHAQCNDVSLASCTNPASATCVRFSPAQYVAQFDNGSGSEAWAYMPRAVMPTVKATATGTRQFWTVDGPPQAADVFIDPFHNGPPVTANRDWRTVLIGGLREGPENGGLNGYYALDVTAPDQVSKVNNVLLPIPVGTSSFPSPPNATATLSVPSCIGVVDGNPPQSGPPGADCTSPSAPLPYPSVLWEFYDQAHNGDGSTALDADGNLVLLDEDGNGKPDLGRTWSTPTIGRIQISDGAGNVIDKYVAIFGGGLDAANKTMPPPGATTPAPNSGNWLYMVDVETGSAIYKAPLVGCAPGTAAAVDTNQVGVINRIYIGTTAGHLYRVDLGPNSQGNLPILQSVNLQGTDGKLHPELRLVDPQTGAAPWTPREIFSTNFNGASPTTAARPIYYSPAVIFDAKLGLFAVAFGTGDREDLWSNDPQAQRYYMFIDDTDQFSAVLPLNESSFTALTETSPNTTTDILENSAVGHRGWFLALEVKQVQITDANNVTQTLNFGERVITDSFALSGINTFSTFEPEVNFAPAAKGSNQSGETCTDTGTSRIFVTFTTTGNTVLTDTGGNAVRFYNEPTFVTAPYTEQAQTKNPTPGTPSSSTSELTAALAGVMNTLKQLFPRNCRFGNYRVDIKAISGDTGVIFIAPVPICIIEKNWKEF